MFLLDAGVECVFVNDTATTEIYTLALHDALPICRRAGAPERRPARRGVPALERGAHRHRRRRDRDGPARRGRASLRRSEEHTSELQSRQYLVCRLLLEKKKHTAHLSARA